MISRQTDARDLDSGWSRDDNNKERRSRSLIVDGGQTARWGSRIDTPVWYRLRTGYVALCMGSASL